MLMLSRRSRRRALMGCLAVFAVASFSIAHHAHDGKATLRQRVAEAARDPGAAPEPEVPPPPPPKDLQPAVATPEPQAGPDAAAAPPARSYGAAAADAPTADPVATSFSSARGLREWGAWASHPRRPAHDPGSPDDWEAHPRHADAAEPAAAAASAAAPPPPLSPPPTPPVSPKFASGAFADPHRTGTQSVDLARDAEYAAAVQKQTAAAAAAATAAAAAGPGSDAAVSDLIGALRHGALQSPSDNAPGGDAAEAKLAGERWKALSGELHEAGNWTVVEVGCSSALADRIAAARPEGTVVHAATCPQDESSSETSGAARTTFPGTVAALLAALGDAPERCTHLVLTDLGSAVSDQALPDELESALAAATRACGAVYVPAALPDRRFFSYWKSAEDLLSAAAGEVSESVDVDTVGKKASAYSRYGLKQQDKAPPADGRLVRARTSWASASRDAPVPRGLSLRQLLGLGPTAATRFRLLGDALAALTAASINAECGAAAAAPDTLVFSAGTVALDAAFAARCLPAGAEAEAAPPPAPEAPAWTPPVASPPVAASDAAAAQAFAAANATATDGWGRRRRLAGLLYEEPPAALGAAAADAGEDADAASSPSPRLAKYADDEGFRSSQAAMRRAERPAARGWWPHLEPVFAALGTARPTVVTVGERLGLLSVKVAKALPRATVVAVRVRSDAHGGALVGLLEMLGVRNVVPCAPGRLATPALGALAAGNDRAAASVVGAAVLVELLQATAVAPVPPAQEPLCDLDRFEAALGAVLGLADVALVELPPFATLRGAVASVLPRCAAALDAQYGGGPGGGAAGETSPERALLARALAALGAAPSTGTLLDAGRAGVAHDVLRVKIDVGAAAAEAKAPQPGVSLYALLHWGVVPRAKAELFHTFLELPLHAIAANAAAAVGPWHVRFFGDVRGTGSGAPVRGLSYVPADGAVAAGSGGGHRADSWPAVAAALADGETAGDGGQFSFVEYGSGRGAVSTRVAAAYPNATVVSLEPDAALAAAHLATVEARGLWGNAVARADLDTALAKNIYESPELFRYQLLGPSVAALLAGAKDDAALGALVGALFSCALTTFARLPSAAHVSLALDTFFPGGGGGGGGGLLGPHLPYDAADARFALASHPRGDRAGVDVGLVHRVAAAASDRRGSTTLSMSSDGAPLSALGGGWRPPLVRADVTAMERFVHHHFEYSKDGHSRTYTMHVEPANATTSGVTHRLRADGPAVSVYLTRTGDGGHIPYETVHGVTLIAILRLGLVKALKERAYTNFLKLPLFEDMAPWNIVFNGPRLDYIDYDTREHTFDVHVRKAYQVLSVLMNYKRTVNDFDKCGAKAKTGYGFSWVSECVGGAEGGVTCDDPALPVPCGDGTCRSDYIHCLKAVNEAGEAEEAAEGLPAGMAPAPPGDEVSLFG